MMAKHHSVSTTLGNCDLDSEHDRIRLAMATEYTKGQIHLSNR